MPKDVKGYTYDIEKAKKPSSPRPRSRSTAHRVGYLTGFSQTEQAATVMQNGLTKVGIQSKVIGYPWPTIVERFKKPETSPDLVVYWICTYYADPQQLDRRDVPLAATGAPSRTLELLQEPEGGRAARQGAAVHRPGRCARRLYEEAARIVVDEAAGLWIYNTKWYGPYAKKLEGILFCPIGNGAGDARWLYYESDRRDAARSLRRS